MFNKSYGFIKYDEGDIYFHISKVINPQNLDKNKIVSFNVKPSNRKKGSLEAINVEVSSSTKKIFGSNIGEIDWFNERGFGVIKNDENEYFFHTADVISESTKISVGDICIFDSIKSKKYEGKYNAKSIILLKNHPISKEIIDIVTEELKKIGLIDEDVKFQKVLKYLQCEPLFKVRTEIVGEILTTPRYKYRFWLRGITNNIEISEIVENMLIENATSWSNSYESIFSRIESDNYKSEVLQMFFEKLGEINNNHKYNQAKAILSCKDNILSKETKSLFSEMVYNSCDKNNKLLLWQDGYTKNIDIRTLCQQMVKEQPTSWSNPYNKILSRFKGDAIGKEILPLFLEELEKIDSKPKYEKIKAIYSSGNLTEEVKNNFSELVYIYCNNQFKYLLWQEEYVEKIDVNILCQQMLNEQPSSWSNPYEEIFSRLRKIENQKELLTLFLNELGEIDNSENYDKIRYLLSSSGLQKEIKAYFSKLVYSSCNEQFKFLLWKDKLTRKLDIDFLCQQMVIETYVTDFYNTIFSRLRSEQTQYTILSKLIDKLRYIDDTSKYEKIKTILKLTSIKEDTKNSFTSEFIALINPEQKLCLWLEGCIKEKDLNYVAEYLTKIDNSYQLNNIFSKLTNPIEQKVVLDQFLSNINIIDPIEKCNKLKNSLILDRIHINIKEDFVVNAVKSSTIEFRYKLLLTLLNCFSRAKHRKYSGKTFLYIYFKDKDYFNWMNENGYFSYSEEAINEDIRIIEKLFNENHFNMEDVNLHIKENTPIETDTDFKELSQFCESVSTFINSAKFINPNLNYSNINKLLLKNLKWDNRVKFWIVGLCEIDLATQNELCNCKNLKIPLENILKKDNKCINQHLYFNFIESIELENLGNKFDLVFGKLKLFRSYMSSFTFHQFENRLTERIKPIKYRIKLWVHDLLDEFDFNNYCFYYFTLTKTERKIFNKKARAIMGEELRKSMLKKREPWVLVSENKDLGQREYVATWKSIWFDDGEIRFCIDKNGNFSSKYSWDFSEEKFNLLFDYISGRRLKELRVWVKNGNILKVENLEELEEIIWKVQILKEVESGNSTGVRQTSENRIPTNIILRNKCIQLLNRLQLKELEPARILEKTFNIDKARMNVDISLLYSIPLNKMEIGMIWESLELEKSKATHIFKCNVNEYTHIYSEIESYLQSQTKVRSSLSSNFFEDVERQKKLRYLCRIDHDNFDFSKWVSALYDALPELRNIK